MTEQYLVAGNRFALTMADDCPLWGRLGNYAPFRTDPDGKPVFSLEFILIYSLDLVWAVWLWVLLPAIGLPLMFIILRKAHRREHKRTRASKLVLDYWILAACIIGVGGFVFGFWGFYEMLENPLICLLVGIGAYLTGGVLRSRSMKTCGLVGAAIGIGAFLLQGDLWPGQTAAVAAVGIVSLLIPGILHARSAAA